MSSSDLFDVQLRPMVDTDRPYVIATWLHSYWQAVQHQQRKADFFMVQHELIERLLQAGRTQIACMGASPSTIVGWACASAKAVIHYVYVREEHRHVVGTALGDRLSQRRPGEQRHREEPACMRRVRERRRAIRVQVVHRDVGEIRPACQCVEQHARRRGRPLHEDPHPAANGANRLIG